MISTFIIFFCCAVVASFLCSVTESGLLSLSRTDIARLKETGRPSARALDSMKRNIDKPMVAVLTLNTVANTVGASGVGSEANDLWGDRGVAAASAVLTISILILGEIIPKSLGARHAYRLADLIALSVRVMLCITYPVVLVLRQLSRLLGDAPNATTTREDITLFAKIGHADGAIADEEADTIAKLMKLPGTVISEVMKPWEQVTRYPHNLTVRKLLDDNERLGFSRMPIYDPDSGRVTGMVRRINIYEQLRKGELDVTLEKIADPIQREEPSASISTAFGRTSLSETMILVEDSSGNAIGTATLEDALEHIFGLEIEDEDDRATASK